MSRDALARREPLTIGAAAPLLAAVAAAIAVVVSGLAALGGGEVDPGWPEAVALVLVAAAGAVLTVGAGPYLAPFRARAHVLVLALLLAAALLDAAAHPATAGGTLLTACPLLLLALAVLRPPAEVLAGGTALAGAATAAALALPPWTVGTPARAASTAVAVLAPAVAAAAFGRVALRRLGEQPVPPPPTEPPPAVRLSLQQEAVARLEAEAIPLLSRVAGAGALQPEDRARAQDIAERLRAAMVADLSRGWLGELGLVVDDAGGYGERLSASQRTALRAAMAALPTAGAPRPGAARIRGQDRDAEVRLDLPLIGAPDRRRAAAAVRLLRSAFRTADLRVAEGRAVIVASWSSQE